METEGAEKIVRVARAWIGTPYHHQASLKGIGCDCLGLLRGVWRELFGVEPEDMPPYAPDWAEGDGKETLRDGLARHLDGVALEAARPGDVMLFRLAGRGPAKHCAIVGGGGVGGGGVGNGNSALTLIHACQGRCVREEPFSESWHRRLAFVFRIRA